VEATREELARFFSTVMPHLNEMQRRASPVGTGSTDAGIHLDPCALLNLNPPRNLGWPDADDRAVAQDSCSLLKRRHDPSMGAIDQKLLCLAGCQRTDAGRLRLRRARSQGSGDGDGEGTQVRKSAGERLLPRPMARYAQRRDPRAVDEPTGQRHEARADGPGDSRAVTVVLVEAAQELTPAKQVVGHDGALEPGRVGSKAARGAVPHTHPLLQIGDVELCLGALAVEGVEGNGGARQIGQAKWR